MFKTKSNSNSFGAVGLIKVVLVFSFRHPKCHFWARKDGHFWKKGPYSGTEKYHIPIFEYGMYACREDCIKLSMGVSLKRLSGAVLLMDFSGSPI